MTKILKTPYLLRYHFVFMKKKNLINLIENPTKQENFINTIFFF